MKNRRLLIWMLYLIAVQIMVPAWAASAPEAPGPSESKEGSESLTEVNKKLTNPVSEVWSIAFQQNNYVVSTVSGQGDKWLEPEFPAGDARVVDQGLESNHKAGDDTL